MRAYHHIHALEGAEEVERLVLEHAAVALAGSRMGGDYHHLRLLLGNYPVHVFLYERDK